MHGSEVASELLLSLNYQVTGQYKTAFFGGEGGGINVICTFIYLSAEGYTPGLMSMKPPSMYNVYPHSILGMVFSISTYIPSPA